MGGQEEPDGGWGSGGVCGGGSAGHTRTIRPCPHVVYRHPKRLAGPRRRCLGNQNSLFLGPHLHPARSYDPARDPRPHIADDHVPNRNHDEDVVWYMARGLCRAPNDVHVEDPIIFTLLQRTLEIPHFQHPTAAKIWTTRSRRYCWNQAHQDLLPQLAANWPQHAKMKRYLSFVVRCDFAVVSDPWRASIALAVSLIPLTALLGVSRRPF